MDMTHDKLSEKRWIVLHVDHGAEKMHFVLLDLSWIVRAYQELRVRLRQNLLESDGAHTVSTLRRAP